MIKKLVHIKSKLRKIFYRKNFNNSKLIISVKEQKNGKFYIFREETEVCQERCLYTNLR